MRIAVDTSVLLDVLGADPKFGERSERALRRAYDRGALVACEVVWSEVRAHFPDAARFAGALSLLGVEFDPMTARTAEAAGDLWRRYCARHPRRSARERVVADFLIGAHARHQADALLSRDRGFFGEEFAGLELIDPAST